MLLKTLKECDAALTVLNVTMNSLDDDCVIALGEYVQDNEHLQRLHFGMNKITDKGIETLSQYLIGNLTLNELSLIGNFSITDKSVPYLIEIGRRSCIAKLNWGLCIENSQLVKDAFDIPLDKREVPIKSNSKSAAKISYSTS